MKKREIREKKIDELKKHLDELRLELSKELSQINIGGSASSPSKIRNHRKTIARILTELKKREEEESGRNMS